MKKAGESIDSRAGRWLKAASRYSLKWSFAGFKNGAKQQEAKQPHSGRKSPISPLREPDLANGKIAHNDKNELASRASAFESLPGKKLNELPVDTIEKLTKRGMHPALITPDFINDAALAETYLNGEGDDPKRFSQASTEYEPNGLEIPVILRASAAPKFVNKKWVLPKHVIDSNNRVVLTPENALLNQHPAFAKLIGGLDHAAPTGSPKDRIRSKNVRPGRT